MDVLNVIIQNSALNGMPKWYQAVTLSLFAIITTIVISTYFLLLSQGADMTIPFSY